MKARNPAQPGASSAPKIPKGFVLVRLDKWSQEELRRLARESGLDLRDAIRFALTQVREDLKKAADFKRKSGTTLGEYHQIFRAPSPDKN